MNILPSIVRRLTRLCPRHLVAFAMLATAALAMQAGTAHAAAESGFRFSRAVVQHLSTGFPLVGAHETTRCESCHVRGMFKGTPKDCVSCHGPGARISTFTMAAGHPVVTQPCTVCHNQIAFNSVKFDHTNAMPGSCASCHNGMQASGKPTSHVVTRDSCDTCHKSTAMWSGATFNHQSVRAGTCTSCHNGTNASGKPGKHIVTSASCDSCHQVTAWNTAKFSHVGIAAGSCASCHNGVSATGMPGNHIPVQGSCDTCHTTTAFSGTAMNHAGMSSGCVTCHETGKSFFGVTIVTRPTPAKDPKHPPSGDCVTCHTTSTFATALASPAGHIPTSQACTLCHTSLRGYKPGVMNHTGISNGCTTCHAAAASGIAFLGVTPGAQGTGHVPTNADCASCHTTSKFGPGTAMNHAPVTGTSCSTCHEAGRSFAGVTIVTRPTPAKDPKHPPTGDCGTCHTTSTFAGASGMPAGHLPTSQACALCHTNPAGYKPGVMVHTGISSGCATCHSAGTAPKSFYGVSAPQPLSHGAGHVPTNGDCAGCHNPTSTAKGGFTGAAMSHTGISAGCAACHDTGKSFSSVKTVKLVVKPANHIPTATACEGCHSASSTEVGGFAGTKMNHAPVAGTACATCHENGNATKYAGVTIVTRPTATQDQEPPDDG